MEFGILSTNGWQAAGVVKRAPGWDRRASFSQAVQLPACRDCPVRVPRFLLWRTTPWGSLGVTVSKQANEGEQGTLDPPSADLGLTHPLQKRARVPALRRGPGLSIAQCTEIKAALWASAPARFFRGQGSKPQAAGLRGSTASAMEAQHRPPILTPNFHLRGSCEVLWTLPKTGLSRGDRRGQDFQAEVLLPLLHGHKGNRNGSPS